MADILDEILAATESVRSQLAKPHSPSLLLPYDPEVSPRGVQDELPFALLHNTPSYFDKPSTPNPPTLDSSLSVHSHQQSFYDPAPFDHHTKWPSPLPHSPDAAAAAAAAAAAVAAATAAPLNPHISSHHHHHHHHQHPRQHQHPQSHPLISTATSPHKRLIEQESPEKSISNISHDQPHKRPKPEPTTTVMPPSAKSILERREKAIREGRRKDAKLTEAERRILRRLRNRESAERCRLRRVQQAVQLEKKIECMQVENDRLVAMAEEYEKTIQRLEQVIANFSKQGASASV